MYQFTDKTSEFGGFWTNRYPKAILE